MALVAFVKLSAIILWFIVNVIDQSAAQIMNVLADQTNITTPTDHEFVSTTNPYEINIAKSSDKFVTMVDHDQSIIRRISSANYGPAGRMSDEQMIEALRKKGHYNMIATFLDTLDLKHVLPESSTLLVPMDGEVMSSLLNLRPEAWLPVFQYHVLTQQFSFLDLQQLPTGQILPTLLINSTVMVTNNSTDNFTVDDVRISYPNILLASNVAVHGLNGVMNSTVFGPIKPIAFPPPSSSASASGSTVSSNSSARNVGTNAPPLLPSSNGSVIISSPSALNSSNITSSSSSPPNNCSSATSCNSTATAVLVPNSPPTTISSGSIITVNSSSSTTNTPVSSSNSNASSSSAATPANNSNNNASSSASSGNVISTSAPDSSSNPSQEATEPSASALSSQAAAGPPHCKDMNDNDDHNRNGCSSGASSKSPLGSSSVLEAMAGLVIAQYYMLIIPA